MTCFFSVFCECGNKPSNFIRPVAAAVKSRYERNRQMGCNCVDTFLKSSFYALGKIVGRHPGYFLIVPFLVSMFCITGFQKIHYNIDPEYLFSPLNGPGKYERAVIEESFKMNYTNKFNVARITRAGRFGRLIVTSGDGIENILRVDFWKELRLLNDLVYNMTVFFEDEYFTYRDVCAKWDAKCFENDILELEYIMDQVEQKKLNLPFPAMINPVTWTLHIFPVYFGGSRINDNQVITSVPAVQLGYFINVDHKKLEAKGSAWEDAFLNYTGELQEKGIFKYIKIARFGSRTLDHELERNTRTVIPFFASTFAAMALFSIITCMMIDWVRSKPLLGLLGNISAGLATTSAFGTCMYLGVDFIGINLAAPFLMIGIGIDDTFVMLAAWRRTSVKDSVPERTAKMLSNSAVSITITSLTTAVSFMIGVYNPFPSVQIFCIYSSVATLYTFIWHLTFFASCVSIAGYLEKSNRHSLLCIKVQPVSRAKHRSIFYRMFCSGGVDYADPDNPLDNKEHGMMIFFRDYFARLLNNSCMKVFVILTFLLYLLGGFYGVTQIEEGLERRKVAQNDSYAVEFFDKEDEFYREFPYRPQVVVSGELDYSNPEIQQEIERLTETFENTSYIMSERIATTSWLRDFLQDMDRDADYYNITINTPENFMKHLKEWLKPSNELSLDVKFNEDGTRIKAMRFMIQAVNISGTNHEKEMVQAMRKICADSPLNVSIFHPYFIFFDQFELVRPTFIQNLIVGAITMMVISFFFIPNLLCSLWVAFSIFSIQIGVIGYMALWKVNLDSISMINLIMCIGFSVDFTAHICYDYMSSKAKRPSERVQECLYDLGMPIFQGATSTVLGMIALLLPNNYLFTVFFKMVFLVVFFGAMHGLFLLPVLLSILGPGSCTSKDEEDDIRLSDIQKTFPHPYCIPHPQFTLNGSGLGSGYKNSPIENGILGGPKINKGFVDIDKDLGLGTSEENSSESSSNKSNKRGYLEEESLGWRRRSSYDIPNTVQLRNSRVLDIFGTETEREYLKRRELETKRRYSDNFDNGDRYRYYDLAVEQLKEQHQQAEQCRRPLGRSSSQHNLARKDSPRFVEEPRFK